MADRLHLSTVDRDDGRTLRAGRDERVRGGSRRKVVTTLALTAPRIPMAIHAADSLSRDGLAAQLRHRPDVDLVSGRESTNTITVVLSDEIDESTLVAVRKARCGGATRVVLVVTRLNDQGLLSAVEAGISSLLLRDQASVERIVQAARIAATGAASMSPELVGRLLEHVGRLQRDVLTPRGLKISGLTEREISVLRLIAEGLDTAEVGRRLFYSERTIKNVVHDITTRLGLRNRTHAVAFALRQGFI